MQKEVLMVALVMLTKVWVILQDHKQRLSIAKELEQRDGEGKAYTNLGDAYQGLGDFRRAIEYHNRHLRIATEPGQKDEEGGVYYSLGYDFELLGALLETLDYYRSSVKLYEEVRALLQSEDMWKISFRNACQEAYKAL